jgi:hypothetical protein
MTHCALNSDRCDCTFLIEKAGYSDDRVQLQERQCRCRIVEIDFSIADGFNNVGRQSLGIHLQAHSEGQSTNARSDRNQEYLCRAFHTFHDPSSKITEWKLRVSLQIPPKKNFRAFV